ncbi:MAG: transpeptidase family protein [Treponema sp.]|nr:transpeptidase family protein [Treponema sp.]
MNGYIKKGRAILLAILALAFSGLIILRYAQLAFTKTIPNMPSPPTVQRGSIVDKNGKTLAVSTNFYHFGVTPSAITDVEAFTHAVAPVLGEDESSLKAAIAEAKNATFVYLKKKLDQAVYDELRDLCDKNKYHFVRFDRIPGRVYPENTLASQLIGYMGDDGMGLAGIEYSMQSKLSPPQSPDAVGELQGKHIYLTIDANLQFKLEKIANAAMENTRAESLMLIAAEAKTGEIISYISLPAANLNEYGRATDEERKDRPATDSYEPGSVFKIFSVASFLDSGAIKPDDLFYCDGLYERKMPSGERIRITCLEHHGWVSAREALAGSCNDALAQMSEKLESEQFLARIRMLGFGERTGVELPGETTGTVHHTSDRTWSARSKPTIAIGQEIQVSALQMVQAATAIANGGIPAQLTFISRITSYDGKDEYIHVPSYKPQVLSKQTANYILSCMETVAQVGTGHRASLGDISIGVKTGTAQMADLVNGGYSKTDFLSNCMAIFPIEDPEIVLYIVIQKAVGETYAGRIVAPVIAEAADAIIDHLGLSRGGAASLAHSGRISIASGEQVTIGATVPNFTGLPKRQLLPLLNRTDIKIKITGDGWVQSQTPEPGTPVTENMEIELFLD